MRFVISAIRIESGQDLLTARARARQVSRLLGFDPNSQSVISAAVSSLARQSFVAASESNVEFAIEDTGTLVIRVAPPVPAGCELDAAQFLMDAVELESGANPVLRMEKRLPKSLPVTAALLSQIEEIFSLEPPSTALDELLLQDLDLLLALKQSEKRVRELEQVNQELDDTNGGVMALYAELDERTQQLRRVSELKSRFLSNLSHEVRTPVNSIVALSGILLKRLDGALSAEQEKQVGFIRESAEQLSRLVNDELDLAKVEAGKISLRITEFSIDRVFGALRGMFKPLLQNPDVTLIFEEPREIPIFRTDEGKISQILRNLISNALKFTTLGEIRVNAQLAPHGRAVVLTVADTGIGISPEDQALIFQEFYQVGSESAARNEGAGIGLHLSRQLAELLGGSLTVTSALHSGAVFTATIPLLCPAEPPAESSDVSNRTMLVIDDDRLSRYVLRQNLGNTTWRILEAESGAEGLSLARIEKPDLIFLDLMMPDVSGFVVLRELKADPLTRDIPVVIVTSMPAAQVKADPFISRAAAILYKSEISTESLQATILGLALENKGRSTVC